MEKKTAKKNSLAVVCEEDISMTKELESLVNTAPWLDKDTVRRDSEGCIAAMESELAAAACDLKTEAGRAMHDKIRGKCKAIFAAYEKNIKAFKQAVSGPAKAVDVVSKLARDISGAAFEKMPAITGEYGLIRAQERLVYGKWQKLEGIPHDKYSIETCLAIAKNSEPLDFSSEKERSDFYEFQGVYIAAIEAALDRLALEEKAKAEESRQLAEQAAELAEREKALAAREAAAMQAAVNPGSPATPKAEARSGAPACEATYEMRAEAVEDIAAAINSAYQCAESVECAKAVSRAIRDGKIRHVRYCA